MNHMNETERIRKVFFFLGCFRDRVRKGNGGSRTIGWDHEGVRRDVPDRTGEENS